LLSTKSRQAAAELAGAVLSLRPMIDRLEQPVRVTRAGTSPAWTAARSSLAGEREDLQRVLDRVTGRLGYPAFTLLDEPAPRDVDTFVRTVSRRLGLAELAGPLRAVATDGLPALDEVVDEVSAADFESFCRRETVRTPDGVALRAYVAGDPGSPAVVIASACGMPARLAEQWIRRLAADHYVLTWESRGLFGGADDVEEFDAETGVAAQAADLVAVMDHFSVPAAHVAGLCGGAVIALAAAAAHPRRVASLSLWHGDFELGDDALKTDHQRNLQALMLMATRSRVSVAGIHAVLCQAISASTPPDLAHLVLYPYATAELLFRYCQLNGAIMGTDVRDRLSAVSQPCLVVTSEDDATAHPEGSRRVARALSGSRLLVAPHGDHISVFRRPEQLLEAAIRFVRQEGNP